MTLIPSENTWSAPGSSRIPCSSDVARQKRHAGSMAYHAGLSAEDQVARDYARRGHTIAAQRWRGKGGEIDLVAREGAQLIFVEVKKSRSVERALAHLTPRQIGRIQMTALEYADAFALGSLTEMRFDVALVDGFGQVNVIENAFM